MTKPILQTFQTVAPMFIQKYERYLPTAFDESMTLLEKVNKIIVYLNQIGKLTNDVVDQWNQVMEWIINDGLKENVLEILFQWLEDGTLTELILELVDQFNVNDYLQNQKTIGFVNNTENGERDFIQGMIFNQPKNELYVVRKDNTRADNIIYRYNATTFEVKDWKRFNTSAGCYNEGFAYFYDDAGDLNFIMRTSYDHTVAIINYTKNTQSENFVVQGSSKHGMDNNQKYYFAHFGDAVRTEGIFLYDFESVKNKQPKLLKKIYFSNNIAEGEKVQTISIINDCIFLGHGSYYPEITLLNFNGDVIAHHAFDKSSLMNMIKKENPEISLLNYRYENEGMCFYEQNGKVYPVLGHMISELGKTYITLLGNPAWEKVATKIYTENVNGGLSWKDVSDWGVDVTPYSTYENEKTQYAKDDKGMVYLRGVVTYPRENTDGAVSHNYNKVLFTLPYPYKPFRNQFFTTPASGGADRQNRIMVNTNGEVILESVYDQGGTAKPFCVVDNLQFYVDTRPN